MLDVILFVITALLLVRVGYIFITAEPEDRKAFLIIAAVLIVIVIGIETQIIPTDRMPKVIDIHEEIRSLNGGAVE